MLKNLQLKQDNIDSFNKELFNIGIPVLLFNKVQIIKLLYDGNYINGNINLNSIYIKEDNKTIKIPLYANFILKDNNYYTLETKVFENYPEQFIIKGTFTPETDELILTYETNKNNNIKLLGYDLDVFNIKGSTIDYGYVSREYNCMNA